MFMYICYVYVEYHNFFIVFLQPSKKKSSIGLALVSEDYVLL